MIARGRGGKIINMASQAGRRGEALVAVYCATKAAVITLTQSAGLDLIKHGINVNAIAPGVVDGEHWDGVDALFAKYENRPPGEKKRLVGEAVPFGRMGTAEDLTGMAVFLAIARGRLHRRPDLQRRRRQLDELSAMHDHAIERLTLPIWRSCRQGAGRLRPRRADARHRAFRRRQFPPRPSGGLSRRPVQRWASATTGRIVGAGVREGDARMRDTLKAQDWLSTVVEQDPSGHMSARVTGAMIDFLDRPATRAAIVGDWPIRRSASSR